MKACLFKATNEFITKFDVGAPGDLSEALQSVLATTPDVPLYSYVELAGQTWSIVGRDPIQLQEGVVRRPVAPRPDPLTALRGEISRLLPGEVITRVALVAWNKLPEKSMAPREALLAFMSGAIGMDQPWLVAFARPDNLPVQWGRYGFLVVGRDDAYLFRITDKAQLTRVPFRPLHASAESDGIIFKSAQIPGKAPEEVHGWPQEGRLFFVPMPATANPDATVSAVLADLRTCWGVPIPEVIELVGKNVWRRECPGLENSLGNPRFRERLVWALPSMSPTATTSLLAALLQNGPREFLPVLVDHMRNVVAQPLLPEEGRKFLKFWSIAWKISLPCGILLLLAGVEAGVLAFAPLALAPIAFGLKWRVRSSTNRRDLFAAELAKLPA